MLPIIIVESGTSKIYSTVEDAELDLEVADVQSGIYRGFDAEGRLLSIQVKRNRVIISPAESDPTHANELENFLREELSRLGVNTDAVAPGNLPKIIEQTKPYAFKPPDNSWEMFGDFFKDFFRTILHKKI